MSSVPKTNKPKQIKTNENTHTKNTPKQTKTNQYKPKQTKKNKNIKR